MKRIILVVLMVVMVSTPCMAEVELTSNFSIDSTLWEVTTLVVTMHLPIPILLNETCGFYQGEQYCCNEADECSQNPITTIEMVLTSMVIEWSLMAEGFVINLMIIQPFGVGLTMGVHWIPENLLIGFQIGIMIKLEDNWIPPDAE